jgi:beta-N-acetylhexosaminidase
VREAAARVRGLGASALPVPSSPAAVEPRHDAAELARLASAFEVSDAARARLAAASRIGTVVRIEVDANIAIGVAPWGPFAVASGGPEPELTWLGAAQIMNVSALVPLGAPASLAALEGPVLVIGKDLHRHPFAVAAIEALRTMRDDVVTVDMGWPADDRAVADVATFGASRLVGAALIDFIAGAMSLAPAET